jgi:hypothetical protein
MVEFEDSHNLWKYTGFKDNGHGINENYRIDVDDPNLKLYEDKLDKTLIYYNNKLINRYYIEFPIFSSPGTYHSDNDLDLILAYLTYSYPIYDQCQISEELLNKTFKYNITKGCQKCLRYLKNKQNEASLFIKDKKTNWIYNKDTNNLPILDYADFAELAYKYAGEYAAKDFILTYIQSDWLEKYTPNAYVDIQKLKALNEKYSLDCMQGCSYLDDKEFMIENARLYFAF